MFIGLMENYERVAELQKIAENSSGALFEASEKQAESLQGRINVLQNAWGNLHSTILTRDMAKDIVDFGTDAVNALTSVVKFLDDNFIPTMAGATAALIAFKTAKDGITFGQLIGQIGQATKKMMGFGETVKGVTAAGITLKSALLGLGVGVVVSLFTKMINDSKEAQAKMDALSDSVATLKSNLQTTNDNDVLITSYYKAKQALDSMVEGTEAQAKQQEKVNELRNALANANPSFKSIIDDENSSLDQQYQKMKLINDMEAKKIAQEALDNAPEQGKKGKGIDLAKGQYGQTVTTMDSALRSLDSWEAKLKELTEQQNSLISADASIEEINKVQEEIDNAYVQIDYQKEKLANSVEENSSLKQQLDSYNSILQANKAIGNDIKDRYEVETQLSEEEQAILDKATSIASEYLNIGKNVNTAKGEVDGLTDSVGDLAEETDKATSSMKKLNQDYVDELNKVEDIKELVEQINTDGLTLELATNALDSGFLDDFTGNITDAVAVQEHLNEKIRESGEIANQAYYNMMKNDEQYWQNKMANSQAWASHEQEVQNEMVKIAAEALGIQETDFSNFINEKGGFREVDYSNAKTMAQAEDLLQSNLIAQISSYTSQLVNHKAGYRQTDMSNIVQFLNTQGAKEAKTVQELSDLWAKFYDAKRKAIEAEINDYYKETQKLMESTNAVVEEEAWLEDGALKHQMLNATKALNTLKKDNTTLTNYFAGIGAMFNGVSGGLSQTFAGGKGTSGGNFSSSPSSDKTSSSGSDSSSSDKDVDDLELEIDRYYELNDAIKDLENSLSSLQTKREQITTKDEYKKSVEEEIALVKKQITAYQNLLKEQQKERDEIKSTLGKNGFKFDSDGDISNYATQLKKLQDNANKKTGEAKEQAIAQVEALADLIDRYNELHNDAIPSTNVEIISLQTEIQNLNKDLEENMKAIEALGDRYFNLSRQMAKVDNAIALNQLLQEVAVGQRKLDLMKEEQELLKEKQRITKEQLAESKKESDELAKQLKDKGVTLNADGSIKNYNDLIKKLTEQADKLVGDAQSEAIEEAEDLLDLIDKYVTLTEDTIPELNQAWQEYANNIASIEEEMKQTAVDAQKDVASAYEHYLTKRYNKVKEMLQKEKDAYNDAYEEESFDRNLKKEQQALDEIAQQIAIYSRDTSEAGKARLEQLKKEYEEQQEAINDMIRENEKNLMNDRFDEEQEKLDEELEDLLSPENLVKAVNEAISSGMITLGDEVVSLNELMTNWIDETGDGLYALGDTIKKDLIGNLQMAKSVLDDMGFKGSVNVPSLASVLGEFKGGTTSNVSFNAPLLQVEGNVDKNVFADLQSEMKKLETSIINKIANSMK